MNYAIVLAAGKSDQMGGTKVDRAFLSLGPKPVLAYALMALEACTDIDGIILVARKERVAAAQARLPYLKNLIQFRSKLC